MAPFCFGLRLNARYRGLPYLRVQQIPCVSGKGGGGYLRTVLHNWRYRLAIDQFP